MRIGIDCRTILNTRGGETAGVGHYTYYLVKHLLAADKKNRYVLFFDNRVIETSEFAQKNVEIVYYPFSQYKKYLPVVYAQSLVSAFLAKAKLDVYHNPANFIPLGYAKPAVITVHDLAIFKHPEWFPGSLGNQVWSKRITVPSSVRRASKIIAVSESTKRDIIKSFKVPANRIAVIYEGVERGLERKIKQLNSKLGERQLKKKHGIQDKFIFYIGTLEPRKNIVGLVKAFSAWQQLQPKLGQKYQLIIAGARGWKYQEVFRAIARVKFGERIRYVGYLVPEHKWALLKLASIFVFPSFYEGFGLPVLEAMSLGTPVITSNISSLPEVTGQAAALINPRNTKQLTATIQRLIARPKLRQKMSALGQKQAGKFSWQKTAQQTLKVYREAVKNI